MSKSFYQRERALEKRFGKLIEDAVQLARDAGCEEPEVYVEGGSGFLVLDESQNQMSDGPDSETIVVDLGWGPGVPPVPCDAGGW